MKLGKRLPSPALIVGALALFVTLGGTVYAAKKTRISGRAIKVKSLPGNRLKIGSVPVNRLKPGALRDVLAVGGTPITGAEIDELSLGQVPEAAHAEAADTAKTATDAQTALNAVNAINAQTVNGYGAGCLPGTVQFAGACWQMSASEAPLSAPAAANSCATQGGTLPDALQLATFAEQPSVNLDSGDEWTSDITNMSGENVFAVVTISASGTFNFTGSGSMRKFRCVIPLVS